MKKRVSQVVEKQKSGESDLTPYLDNVLSEQNERVFYFGFKENNGATVYTPIKCTSKEFKELKSGNLTPDDINTIKKCRYKILKQSQNVKK